jgi:hypothetical protein
MPGMIDDMYFVEPKWKGPGHEGCNASNLIQTNHSKTEYFPLLIE